MQRVRCLIVESCPVVLADIVQSIADQSADIHVIGRVRSLSEAAAFAARDPYDVLILGMDKTALPTPCVDIMNRISNLSILGLVDDGRQLAAYLNNVDQHDILRTIRMLGASQRESPL